MTIDILEYELKYKNNRHVIDLLDAFKEQKELEQAGFDEYSAAEDEKYILESEIRDMKDNISDWRKQISIAIGELSGLEDLEEKEVIFSYVKKALKELDSVESDMK